MGDETDNPFDVDNVKLFCEHLLIPTWEMVEYIDSLTSKDNPSNWIESLHVALNFIQQEVL